MPIPLFPWQRAEGFAPLQTVVRPRAFVLLLACSSIPAWLAWSAARRELLPRALGLLMLSGLLVGVWFAALLAARRFRLWCLRPGANFGAVRDGVWLGMLVSAGLSAIFGAVLFVAR